MLSIIIDNFDSRSRLIIDSIIDSVENASKMFKKTLYLLFGNRWIIDKYRLNLWHFNPGSHFISGFPKFMLFTRHLQSGFNESSCIPPGYYQTGETRVLANFEISCVQRE